MNTYLPKDFGCTSLPKIRLKTYPQYGTPMNLKTSSSNFRFLHHFCMAFNTFQTCSRCKTYGSLELSFHDIFYFLNTQVTNLNIHVSKVLYCFDKYNI